MVRKITLLSLLAFGGAAAWADQLAIGYVSWDVNFPGNAGQFDITNLSGPNSSAPDFPVTTTVNLSSLSLKVDFVGGSSKTFGSSYFTLSSDGISFNGTAIPIGGTNPLPIDATLTGTFSPLTVSAGGPPESILAGFTATISDTPHLVDGDLAIIYATTGTTSPVPEPTSVALLGTVGGLLLLRRKNISGKLHSLLRAGTNSGASKLLLAVVCVAALGQTAFGQVNLAASTTPSNGVAGINNVNITGSGFPGGTITPANVIVTFASSCGGAAVTTAPASTVKKVIGSTDRVNVSIPVGLATGNYYLTVADSAGGDADFTSNPGSCSLIQVTASSAVLNACVAGSSLGVLLPSGGAAGNVTAYVPKGWWGSSTTGVFVQNIEGTIGGTATIATPSVANSCSSNPATGETICVANDTDVYLITGSTLNTTLHSSSNTFAGFSGGECQNCGVALNAANNTAVINMGVTGGTSGSGVQILDLGTNTFHTAFPMANEISENISVDPTRSLVLSANEEGNFTLDQIQADGSLKEFSSSFSIGGESDSTAEDCSTGIGISPQEFTNNVALVNLNAITFGSTTYSAPNAVATLSTVYSFSAGLSGSAVAQGSGHLAVVTGEFGGNTFAVLQLPATAGAGTPSLVDYAVAAIPGSTACGGAFSAGFDPHTVTAYTSPNTGDSYAVFAGYVAGVPACLAVVDMTTVINSTLSPRGGGGYGAHDVSPSNLPAGAVKFFPL